MSAINLPGPDPNMKKNTSENVLWSMSYKY